MSLMIRVSDSRGGATDRLFGVGAMDVSVRVDPADPSKLVLLYRNAEPVTLTLNRPFTGYPFGGSVVEMACGNAVVGRFEPPLPVAWKNRAALLKEVSWLGDPGVPARLLAGADTLIGASGDDVLRGYGGDDTLDGGDGGADTLVGGDGSDVLTSGRGFSEDRAGDLLDGGAGRDRLVGRDGDDTLDGGRDEDTMEGGRGDDVYVVDAVGDRVIERPGEGIDEIRTALAVYGLPDSGSGDPDASVENLTGLSNAGQQLHGNGLANVITGGAGDDTLVGGRDGGGDTLVGGEGNDRLVALWGYGPGSPTPLPSPGPGIAGSRLEGGAGGDTLEGSYADDTLDGGSGDDLMAGGEGDDVYVVDGEYDRILERDGEGTDEVRTALASYRLENAGSGSSGPSGGPDAHVENLTGLSDAGQFLAGNNLANVITGGAGDDTLVGSLDGLGGDTLVGGAGDDQLVALYGHGSPYGSPSGSPDPRMAGSLLQGGAGQDMLLGASGNDTLDGGSGDDLMAGAEGDDVYLVDGWGDRVSERAGEGTDEIRTALSIYALRDAGSGPYGGYDSYVENLTGLSDAGQELHGNNLANVITGGGGNDTLVGGWQGFGDTLIGGDGDDRLVALWGYGSGSPYGSPYGTPLPDPRMAGSRLEGGAGRDLLEGSVTNDTLDGGSGDDGLAGGWGDDVYIVDSQHDQILERDREGTDEVRTALQAYRLADATFGSSYGWNTFVENLTGLSDAGQWLQGNNLANVITGAGGNDTLVGGGNGLGGDTLIGGAGDDLLVASENYDPFSPPPTMAGSHLEGGAGADLLLGSAGGDTLAGGDGFDRLTGGDGADTFLFRSAAEGGDGITDFAADDLIALSASGFGVADPALVAFEASGGPAGSGPALVFDAGAGTLHFDADGSGWGEAVLIARIEGGHMLTQGQILWA